jgi:hypothetical protein
MAYQVKTVVPWAWKYYIRRRKEDRRQDSPEQLYNWVRSQEEQQRRRGPRQARGRISQEERRLGGTSIGGLAGPVNESFTDQVVRVSFQATSQVER